MTSNCAKGRRPATTLRRRPGISLKPPFESELGRVPGFDRRAKFKEDFVYMLYRCRSYILRLQPATRRSLSGPRIEASRAALEDTVRAGRSLGYPHDALRGPHQPGGSSLSNT